MDAKARRDTILRLLGAAGFVSVSGLTRDLGVSDMTVRRDLRKLEADGALTVVHGGASLVTASPRGGGFAGRVRRQLDAKLDIARAAVELIPPETSIVLDAGTSVFEVAKMLPGRFTGYVFTHSVPVLAHMVSFPEIHVHALGGELQPESQALIGPTTIENLAKVQASLLFLGAAAMNERGIFVAKDLERSTKNALIRAVDRVVLVADHSKLLARAPVRLAELDVVDVLVTDRPVPAAMERACRQSGVEVIVAEAGGARTA